MTNEQSKIRKLIMGIVYIAMAIAIIIIAFYSPEIANSFAKVTAQIATSGIEKGGNVMQELVFPTSWALAAAIVIVALIWGTIYVKKYFGENKCVK